MLRRSIRRFALSVSLLTVIYTATNKSRVQRNVSHNAQSQMKVNGVKKNSLENLEGFAVDRNQGFQKVLHMPASSQNYFIAPNRIFHLDLKGAAPKMDYLLKLVPFIKQIGATGIMIEYEDMFPFTGKLSGVKASNAYTLDELRRFLHAIQAHNLDIIPLVQTVGHLEYILKYPNFTKYREEERYPQVICLTDEGAVDLVQEAVRQILNLHEDFALKYFHIGADEVFQIGRCEKDRNYMVSNNVDTEFLLLKHIARIAKFVKAQIPKKKVNVLIWHDMLVNLQAQNVLKHGLSELVEPVVWNYMENLDDQLLPDFWQRLSSMFSYAWGASAYKVEFSKIQSADGPDQYASNVQHYLNNHISWLKQMNEHHSKFKQFRGIIVTGWQRFDHFAIICEVIPVGLLSAAVNMAVLKSGQYGSEVMQSVSEVLKCSSVLYFDKNSSPFIPQCTFPGIHVFHAVQTLHSTINSVEEQVFNDYQVRGWIARFNEKHLYTQAWYLDQVLYKVKSFLREMEICEQNIKTEMQTVFYNDTVAEFVYVYVKPTLKRLEELSHRIDKLSELRVFPRRPFAVQEF
uniref:beta-N-acetylhexosaminidase n=1 Tax=Onchocerca volvulus TaxID=6282 RepID=A0A8R1TU21_ONCVO